MMRRVIDAIEGVARRAGVIVVPAWRLTQLDEESHIGRLLEYLKVDCVLDVGANVGQYAQKLRRYCGYKGLILSFEPNPACWDKLNAAAAQDPLWKVYPVALGAESGVGDFQAYGDSLLGSMLEFDKISGNAPREMKRETIKVGVMTLAEMLPGLQTEYEFSRPFLKLDTQGFDLQVATGAGDHLKEFLGIQSEVSFAPIYKQSPMFAEVVQFYQDRGFVLSRVFPNNDVHFPKLVEMDVAMIRADQIKRRGP